MAHRLVVRRTIALVLGLALAVLLPARSASASTTIDVVDVHGGHALWLDWTDEGTARWFIVSGYQGASRGSSISVAQFIALEGFVDPEAGWTWISVLGGISSDPQITVERGGTSIAMTGEFDLYRCDDADCTSGFEWVGTTDVVSASWEAAPARPDGSPGFRIDGFNGIGCLVDLAAGALMHRPADATATFDGITYPEATTDFANAEIEFASNRTIGVCLP
jgi:hypothetical protein